LEHLEQAPLGFRLQRLDEPKAFAGREILLVVSPEGQDTLADNDFEMLLFLLPVADIAPINPDRERAIGDRKCGPIGRASLDM
jgi:hypothetical protein